MSPKDSSDVLVVWESEPDAWSRSSILGLGMRLAVLNYCGIIPVDALRSRCRDAATEISSLGGVRQAAGPGVGAAVCGTCTQPRASRYLRYWPSGFAADSASARAQDRGAGIGSRPR